MAFMLLRIYLPTLSLFQYDGFTIVERASSYNGFFVVQETAVSFFEYDSFPVVAEALGFLNYDTYFLCR